jgi:hypothetical protein
MWSRAVAGTDLLASWAKSGTAINRAISAMRFMGFAPVDKEMWNRGNPSKSRKGGHAMGLKIPWKSIVDQLWIWYRAILKFFRGY